MKTSTLLVIGGACVLGYLLLKGNGSGSGSESSFGSGGFIGDQSGSFAGSGSGSGKGSVSDSATVKKDTAPQTQTVEEETVKATSKGKKVLSNIQTSKGDKGFTMGISATNSETRFANYLGSQGLDLSGKTSNADLIKALNSGKW